MSLKNRIIGLAAIGAAALTLAPTALAKPAAKASTIDSGRPPRRDGVATTAPSADLRHGLQDPAAPVFAPWGDSAFYSLVRGGDFEAGARRLEPHRWGQGRARPR